MNINPKSPLFQGLYNFHITIKIFQSQEIMCSEGISRMDSSSVLTFDDQPIRILGEKMQGLLQGLTVSNVQHVARQFLNLNLIDGRGQFCEAITEFQIRFPHSSSVCAALVAIINSEFPDVGLLLVKRAVLQFKEGYECGSKERMGIALKLLAHLVNQFVVYEVLALDILMLLLGNPSSKNIETAVSFCTECGSTLLDLSPRKLKGMIGEFQRLVDKGLVEKRVQRLIGGLFGVYKNWKFKEFDDGLEMVEVGPQVTHEVSLLHDIDPDMSLNDLGMNFDVGDEDCEGSEVCS